MAKLKAKVSAEGTPVKTRTTRKTKSGMIKTQIIAKKKSNVRPLINTKRMCIDKLHKLNCKTRIATGLNKLTANVSTSSDGALERSTRSNARTKPGCEHSQKRRKELQDDITVLEKTTAKVRKCVVRLKRASMPATKNLLSPLLEVSEKATENVRKCVVRPKHATKRNVNKNGISKATPMALNSNNGLLLTEAEKNLKKTKPKNLKLTKLNFKLTTEMRSSLKKLSLGLAENKSAVAQHNDAHDISDFEPTMYSTAFDCELVTKGVIEEAQTKTDVSVIRSQLENRESAILQKSKLLIPNTSSFKKSQNLAGKVDIIEQLLNSDDDNSNVLVDSEISHVDENENQKTVQLSTTINKANKFFHTKDYIPIDCDAKCIEKKMTRKTDVSLKSNKSCEAKGYKLKPKNSVYEFLSQSQTSGSDTVKHDDPTSDIIQKLIKQGKVSVATIRRGTGRPFIKRMVKQCKKPATVKSNKYILKKRAKGVVMESDDYVEYDDMLRSPSPTYSVEEYVEPQMLQLHESRSSNDHSADGTFSRLARSVLVNEAGKMGVNHEIIREKRRLLEVARKFVSTPVNHKNAPPLSKTNISPIVPSSKSDRFGKQLGNVSPWRVTDDTHMPSVFYFSRNSSNLPSFSSEFIPPTPSKTIKAPQSNVEYSDLWLKDSQSIARTTETAHTTNSPSSFSSNDSNAENMSPPHTAPIKDIDANADIFNLRQLPNPRRTLQNRSPLKAIKILEVVKLPPWKSADANNTTIKVDESDRIACINSLDKSVKDNSAVDLFGFEDFLQNENDVNDITNETRNSNRETSQCDLRERLHNLKKWRPNNDELPQSPAAPIAKVFDENAGKPRLRDIKEMLCSTMIHPTVRAVNTNDGDINDEAVPRPNNAKNQKMDLFNDTDPQLSFNENVPHQTYQRPLKRKRKQRHNFVLFLDSDESEGEDSHENQEKYSINENDGHKKKKHHKHEQKPNADLNTFVQNFNQMCQEVNDYKLVVE